MITRFQDISKDKGFLLPSVSGPQGKLPFAGTNYGADARSKSFKSDTKVKKFKEYSGEYRKGSNKFGKIVSRIMEFLRLPEFKNRIEENDGLRFRISDFEKRSHMKISDIQGLLNKEHNLYSFDIYIDKKYITFSNLNKTYKDRYVSGRKDG